MTRLIVVWGLLACQVACFGGGGDRAPTRGAKPLPPLQPEPSVIMVAVELSYDELRQQIASSLPETLVEEEGTSIQGPWKLDLKVGRSGDIGLRGKPDGDLRLTIPLRADAVGYNGVLNKKGAPARGGARVEAGLELFVDLGLGVGKGWKTTTEVTTGFTWTRRPRLSLGPLSFDITSKVDPQVTARLPDIASEVQNRMAERDQLPASIREAWSDLSVARVVREDPRTWVAIQPLALQVGEITAREDAITYDVGLQAIVRTGLGDPPELAAADLPEPKPLPRGGPRGMRLPIDVSLPWDEVSAAATNALKGQSFPIEAVDGAALEVRSMILYPSGERIAVGLGYRATSPVWDTDGMVWLTARPVVDGATRAIRFEDFDYTFDTWDLGVSVANFGPVRDAVKAAIADKLVVPFGDRVDEALAQANAELKKVIAPKGRGTLSVELEGASLDQLYPTDDALTVRAVLTGTVRMQALPPK